MPRPNFLRAAALFVALGAPLAINACDGGNDGVSTSKKPTAAELKAVCDAVFDKIIGCGGLGAMVAPNYKASTCTESNAEAFAACSASEALLAQAQSCQKLNCDMAASCGLGLVSNLQACLPADGGI